MPNLHPPGHRGVAWFTRRRRTVCSASGSASDVCRIAIRSRPVADRRSMRDEPGALPPIMQLIAGGLERKTEPRLGSQIQDDLMRRARGRSRDCAVKPGLDRTMQMPAEDPLDLRLTSDSLGKGRAVAEPGQVHAADAS